MKFAFPTKKLTLRALVAGLFLVAFAFSYFRVFDVFELQTYDLRCHLRGNRVVSPDISIIEIDNDSLRRMGSYPFSRTYYAALIEILNSYGAKAIAFDILFVEPNPETDPEVAAIALSYGNVYFPVVFEKPVIKEGLLKSSEILTPLLANYASAAKRVGFANAEADIDGKRRRVSPVIHYQDKPYFYLPLAVALEFLRVPEEAVRIVSGKYLELTRDLRLPIDSEGHSLVSFAGKWSETFNHYGFADVISSYQQIQDGEKPNLDLHVFKGKICYVGATATGTFDTNGSPLEPIYPGVGIHVNLLNSILTRDFIQRASRWQNLLLLILLSMIVFFVSLRLKPTRALLHTLSVAGLYFSSALVIFRLYGIWIDLFTPLCTLALVYSGTTLTKILSEIKKRSLIENELKVASQIQKSFLPEKLPTVRGISLAAYFKPAKAVGGDLYSFVSLGEKKLGVMLGDVSGKGTPAALFMSKVVSEFKFSSRGQTDPAFVLTNLNNAISSESTGGLFVTLTYVIFDLEAGKLILTNGGHLPLVKASADGQSELIQAEDGMPVGVMEGVAFANFEKPIQSGDCFAFYSDGVSEARNKKKDEYGMETLLAAVTKYRSGTAKEIMDKTVQELNHFMGKADQHDDITLIIAKIEPTA